MNKNKLSFEEQIALIQIQLWKGTLECNWKNGSVWMPIGNPETTHQFNFADLDYRVRKEHNKNKEAEGDNP